MSECNDGKGGVSKTLRNNKGGSTNLTVPYRGGEGGSKIQKIALRNF